MGCEDGFAPQWLQAAGAGGLYTLYMNATSGVKLPYGNIPRLLLAYITTEAVRTQSRALVIAPSPPCIAPSQLRLVE